MTVERHRSVPWTTGRAATREPAGAAVPRESVTRAISAAMFREPGETGCARMSAGAVARRAGVGKAAVCRRRPSRQAMLIDLAGGAVRRHAPAVPGTGSLSGDTRAFLDVHVARARYPQVSPAVLFRLLITGDSVTDDYLTRLTGMIIGGLRA